MKAEQITEGSESQNEDDYNVPSWDELNDWCFQNANQVWEAVRYLHLSSQVQAYKAAWESAGKPDIRT